MAKHPLLGMRVSPVVLPKPGDYSMVGEVVTLLTREGGHQVDSCVVAWNDGTRRAYRLDELIGYDDPETWNRYARGQSWSGING